MFIGRHVIFVLEEGLHKLGGALEVVAEVSSRKYEGGVALFARSKMAFISAIEVEYIPCL